MENTQIFEMADRLKSLQEQKKDLEAQTKALAAEIEYYPPWEPPVSCLGATQKFLP